MCHFPGTIQMGGGGGEDGPGFKTQRCPFTSNHKFTAHLVSDNDESDQAQLSWVSCYEMKKYKKARGDLHLIRFSTDCSFILMSEKQNTMHGKRPGS